VQPRALGGEDDVDAQRARLNAQFGYKSSEDAPREAVSASNRSDGGSRMAEGPTASSATLTGKVSRGEERSRGWGGVLSPSACTHEASKPFTISQELRELVYAVWGRSYDVRLLQRSNRTYMHVMWRFLVRCDSAISLL